MVGCVPHWAATQSLSSSYCDQNMLIMKTDQGNDDDYLIEPCHNVDFESDDVTVMFCMKDIQ